MANRRPVDFAVLRGRIRPIDALRLLGWCYTTHVGESWRGPCPLHKSNSEGSRVFSVTDRVWHCHKCREGGDAVRLWARLHGLDDLAAALELCEKLGVAVPTL
ncbi:MAG: CHC2 zinc finger domain-containing protein [Terriglobales bacterium]